MLTHVYATLLLLSKLHLCWHMQVVSIEAMFAYSQVDSWTHSIGSMVKWNVPVVSKYYV